MTDTRTDGLWALPYPSDKVFAIFNATPRANQYKARMIAAPARREDFSPDTYHFVNSGMPGIVRDFVNARRVDFIARFVNFSVLDGWSVQDSPLLHRNLTKCGASLGRGWKMDNGPNVRSPRGLSVSPYGA